MRCSFRLGLSRPNSRKKDEVGKIVPHFELSRGLDRLLPDLPNCLTRTVELRRSLQRNARVQLLDLPIRVASLLLQYLADCAWGLGRTSDRYRPHRLLLSVFEGVRGD